MLGSKTAAMAAAVASLAALPALAQYREPAFGSGTRIVDITVENLHDHLVLAPWVLAAHGADAPLFREGEAASLALRLLAEDGNTDPLMAQTQFGLGQAYGSTTVLYLVPPQGVLSGALHVSDRHPLVSGVAMIGQTNDGIVGFDSVDAASLTGPVTLDLLPLDAGTEANTEAGADLGYLGGLGRPAESLPIRAHPGTRGDRDIDPRYRFDPARAMVRVTIAPRPAD